VINYGELECKSTRNGRENKIILSVSWAPPKVV